MSELEKAESKIKQISDQITEMVNKANFEAKNAGSIATETKSSLDNLTQKFNELQGQTDRVSTAIESLKLGSAETAKSGFYDLFKKAFEDARQGSTKNDVFSLTVKSSLINLKPESLVGEVIQSDRQSGIISPPERSVHVRSFLSPGATSRDNISYVEEQEYLDNTGMVAEGQKYARSTFKLIEKVAPIRKVGTTMKNSREIIEDIPGLYSWLANKMAVKLRLKEDRQLIYGSGTGNNLKGLAIGALTFDPFIKVKMPQMYDLFSIAGTMLTKDEYYPTAIMINPVDYTKMALTKNANGDYVLPLIFNQNGNLRVLNVPVIDNSVINVGEFLIGDFIRGAQLYDRRSVSLETSEDNEDDFERDLMTFKISERIGMPIYRPTAFVTGNIAEGLAGIALNS